MIESLLAAIPLPLIAAFSAAALLLIATSALRLSSAGRSDPSDEARSLTLALYGCLVALLALGLFVTFL
ncbi:hypothetical protein GCM10010387_04910 [Streptomyces inusitatus]|uniref:Uncharacterized protein n=1 Tax=Streptomyces inusitatus TaxID=68221 RepID=A0A918PP26_9ACTN|nr:hypothetical protein [Streptomyces inusitatus]GGZ15546.1 hypothetical protein GCM10010387_04910 [Streptomyces inusitatus]